MSAFRIAAFWIAIIVITMLTLNIKIETQSNSQDELDTSLLRKKRAVGTKPGHVRGVCGGTSHGRSGWLASPNFPGSSYPALMTCNWTITVFPRMVIQFDFVYIDMEDAPIQKRGGCMADYIMIQESQKEDSPLVGGQRYCGFDTTFPSIYTKSNKAYVYFKSDHDKEYQGFAIHWRAVEPPKVQFDCDFESIKDLCTGWEQSKDDDYDWTTHNGQTQSGMTSPTGPLTDRTKKNEFGVYLYTEASGVKKGQKAVLLSPTVRVTEKKGQCLKFWYHMRGETMGTLNVYQKEILSETNSTRELVFSKSGEQSQNWRRADINVTATNNKIQFLFEGIRGSSYKSDMAIDDIQMLRKPCPIPRPKLITTKTPATRPIFARTRRPTPSTTKATRRPTTTRRSRAITTTPFTTTTQADCFYNCKEVGNCVDEEYFCDGIRDCLHKDDEEDCSAAKADSTSAAPTTSEWDKWSTWTSCTVTCGGGRSERERKCIRGGPFDCFGSSSEGIECNTQQCLYWNEWADWSGCSRSCGEGVRMRSRTCNGGETGQLGCIGPYIEVDFCNRVTCPKWSEWTQWSACQVSCGNGAKSRARTCQGAQNDDGPGCIGNATETKPCTHPTNPSCGEWTEWTGFSECTRSCGVGRRMRSRQCRKNGVIAQGCPGSRTDEENCNTVGCPEWAEWKPYSACSVTCGNGVRSRLRQCMQDGVESQSCSGDSKMEEECTYEACKDWAEWAPWSRCTSSCGTGFHGRRRLCMKGEVRSVGCSGKSIETGLCNTTPCPSWREWGNWQSCSRTCGGGMRERRRSCDGGAPNTGDCIGSDMEQEDCNAQSCTTTTQATTTTTTTTRPPTTPKRKTPMWSDWLDWNPCSERCGLGSQQRRRICINGRVGRRGCRGKVKETQDCNEGPCTTATTTTATTTTTTKPRGWGLWTDWSSCTVSCGKGTETRTRECHGTKPGRKGCRGKKKDIRTCQTSCPEPTPAATTAKCFTRNAAKSKKGGRKCPPKCTTDEDCQREKKCVCDGLCGKTCQSLTKRCSDIVSQNEKPGTTLACSAGNSVGSVCTFSCQEGYKLEGDSAVICQGTSKWTNEKNLPTCTASTTAPTTPSPPQCDKKKRTHNACCGTKPYNSRSAKCCDGKVSPGSKAATECCASRPYDPKKRGCCKDKVYWMSREKCKNGRVVKM